MVVVHIEEFQIIKRGLTNQLTWKMVDSEANYKNTAGKTLGEAMCTKELKSCCNTINKVITKYSVTVEKT